MNIFLCNIYRVNLESLHMFTPHIHYIFSVFLLTGQRFAIVTYWYYIAIPIQ